MKTHLEVLFTPAEFALLRQRDLSRTACVVFDVLRATTTMLAALANGARAVVPVAEINEALAWRLRDPAVLLAGERDGVRIHAALTGGVEFDLGNSPREFIAERVAGRTIVMTTSNGTRAVLAAAHAAHVLLGALVNVSAVAGWIERVRPRDLMLVCSGTLDQASSEDTLAAGAVCDLVWPLYQERNPADSAHLARQVYLAHRADLLAVIPRSRNGRRLWGQPELRDDVPFCLRPDALPLLAKLGPDGMVRILKS